VNDRTRRVADNEQRFRVFNDQVRQVRAELDTTSTFACDAATPAAPPGSTSPRTSTPTIRTNLRWFAVLPGHDTPDLERVLGRTSRYLLVQKTGDGAERVR
jgi:hypothetical protein